MSRKTALILGLFFLASFLFYLGVTREKHEGAKTLLTPLGREIFKEADFIEIYQGKEKKGFKLEREGERWILLSDFRKPAKDSLVEDFLKTLASLSGEERASGEKYFSRFGVDQDQGLHIVLKKDGKVLAHFILGRRGPQWESSFLRLEGEKKIYLVPTNLLAKLEIWEDKPAPPQEKAFLDLEVLSLPLDEIKELSFEGPQISWRLKREDKKFVFQKDKREREISFLEGKKFLRKLFPLLAEEVVSPQEFKKPEATLTYVLRNGLRGRLYLGCQQKACLVKKREFVFRVKKENLKPLFEPGIKGQK